MSSGTLSSSPGPSTLQQNSKRALSASSKETEDRLTKKSRTTSEEPSITIRESNSTAKDKKKRHRKKKRKVSVVVIEDGHARIKDSSRRGVSQALVPLTPPSPVKLGESSRSWSKPTVLVNDERDVEVAILHSPKDKGKGKTVESDDPNTASAEQKIARLTKELAFKNELIEKHQTALTQTQQSITCQICLELMYNPYALSPCGHLACYDCLLGWFKATPEDWPDPPPVLARKKTCPHCRAAITDRPVQVWGVKSIVSCFAKSGLLQGSFLSADEAAEAGGNSAVVGEGRDPWDGIFRRKQGGTRSVTRDWERNVFGGSDDERERGIGILDDEDGGVYRCYDCMHEIWDGLCSNCGRAYPIFDDEGDDGDFYLESDDDDIGDDGDDVRLAFMAQAHLNYHHHALGFGDHQHPQPDEEEGPHEDMQARLIEIEAERAADEGREPEFGAVVPFFGSDDDADTDDGEEEEEEYEGSFIDDENDVGIPVRRLVVSSSPPPPRRSRGEVIELSSGSEDEEFPARRSRRPFSTSASARRGGGGRGGASSSQLSPIEVSDDEDDEDGVQEVRRPFRARVRGRLLRGGLTTGARPIVILSDSDDDVPIRRRDPSRTSRNATRVESMDEDEDGSDDGIDPNLALRIAAEERDLYGEDDSITRHRGHHQGDILAEEEDLSSAVLDDDADGEDEDMSWGAEHEDEEEEGEDGRESYDSYTGW